jgi:AmmeMemoRadiSam system protein A
MNRTETDTRGSVLLALARAAIAQRLGLRLEAPEDAAFLSAPGASFVTLMQSDRLRGCIGSLEARRPLREDVRENARAAAFGDPRFPPLAPDEFNRTLIQISLLSPLAPIAFQDENEAATQLEPGVDGVVLECNGRRGTFLPQVWDSLPEPRAFLVELKRKAGLPADFWSGSLRLYRYRVDKWSETA